MGIVRPTQGSIIAEIDGIHHDLIGRTTEEIVDLGIALVPEGRRLFPKLTVEENLLLGAFRRAARARAQAQSTKSAARPFRGWPNAAGNSPAAFPAANSRCWRSAAR